MAADDALLIKQKKALQGIALELIESGICSSVAEGQNIAESCSVHCYRRPSDSKRVDIRIEMPNGYNCHTISKVSSLITKPPRPHIEPKVLCESSQCDMSERTPPPPQPKSLPTKEAVAEEAHQVCTSGRGSSCYCNSGRTRAILRMDKVDGTILESYCSQADAARKLGFRPSQMTQALLEGKEHAEPIPGGGYLTYRDGVPLGGWKSEAGRRLVLVDDQTVQKKKANVVSRKCGGGRRPEKRAKIVHKAVDSIQRPRKKKVPSHCYFDASRATFGPITRAKEALEEEVNEYTGDDALHNFLSGLDLHAISPSHLRERQAFFEFAQAQEAAQEAEFPAHRNIFPPNIEDFFTNGMEA